MKTGIYGGTFSPVHMGHVRSCSLFLDAFCLDRLVVMPAGIPPHKEMTDRVAGDVRLEMCRAAFLPLSPKIEVSDFEIKKGGKSYTIDTVRHYAGDDVILLCGTDMLLCLDCWMRAAELMSLCQFAVIPRRADETEKILRCAERLKREYGARISLIDAEPLEVSSSEIRERIRRGDDVSSLVPGGVMEIIRDRGLYR